MGVLTGLLGVGGGVVWLPALVYLVGQRSVKAAGTSLMLVWISALIGTALHVRDGNVSWPLWLCMLGGGVAGAQLGGRIGVKLEGRRLRFYFIFILLVAVGMIGYRLIAMLAGSMP